ncbi:MAG: DNA primase [Blastocatellia bacterium]|nr:DNA primase [Blastocatellia bacterium]
MRIPRGFSDELRNQADIVRIVSDYVSLKKKGRDYAACCPFHNEKTPSFYVSAGKQMFKCFGCGKGGSVFNFVMEIEGCSFPESVKIVADKCGIPIPAVTEDPREHEEREQQRAELLRMNQWAVEFFEQSLIETDEGRRAQEYLARRGVSDEMRKYFHLGYAPNGWDGMGNFLKSRGASRTQIERSGLVTLKEAGGFYDRFRGRLMFPICDTQGRVVAFGGRILGEGEPKYLNSPETQVYTKGLHLYGLSHARDDIRRRGYAILVEGYLDFLLPFQHGVRNVIASLGTALTENQVRLLGRYAKQIVVNFDPDSAGVAATKRSLELLLAEGFKVNVLSLPDNLDPDEYIRGRGAESYLKALKGSQPFLEYIIEDAVRSHDQTRPAGKVETINAILPYLKLVKDRIERAEQIERIAERLKIESRLIRDEFKKAAETRAERISNRAMAATLDVKSAEKKLLETLLHGPGVRKLMLATMSEEDYRGLRTARLFELIFEFERQQIEPTYSLILEQLDDEDLARDLLPELMIGLSSPTDDADPRSPKNIEREAAESLHSLRCANLAEKQAALQVEINQAQRANDTARLSELMMLKFDLAKKERNLAQINAGKEF